MNVWENAELMFPQDVVPGTDNIEPRYLKYSGYDAVSYKLAYMARNMIIREDQLTWTKEGDFTRDNIYNVFAYPCPDGTPALSVYGAKMLLDAAELGYRVECFSTKTGEEPQYAGFNYTGL